MTKTLSPKEVAERHRVAPRKICRFIESGELVAINIASRLNGEKPRWRITPEALADFERRRSSSATAPTKQPARRRRNESAVIQFF
jgi:hypothetical protein